MEAVNLLTGYADKLKAANKELTRLERASKKLSEKQTETDEERERLEDSIAEHRREVASLHGENQDLQLSYMQAVYEQDVSVQRDVQARRQEIETALQEHTQAIDELSKSLDELPSYEQEAAKLAGELEALNFGSGFKFAMDLKDVLARNESVLKSRQSDARKSLPNFSDATRLRVDATYREEQERKQRADENEARRVRAIMEENERKANRVTGIRRAQ